MKKILLSLIIFMITVTPNVFASTNTRDRNSLENLGVNKKFKITDNNRSNVLNTKSVDASEKIYDFSDILTDEEEKKLKLKIDDFVEKNQMNSVILTDSISYNSDIENGYYAADFYDYNDFGMAFDNYSGIVFFRNTYESDPYYGMYTFGEAILYFKDSEIDSILDSIYDNIHSRYYLEGIKEFIDELEDNVQSGKIEEASNYYFDENGKIQRKDDEQSSKNEETSNYYFDENGKIQHYYSIPWTICIGISSALTLIIMIILVKKNKMIAIAKQANVYLNKDSVNITKRKDVFITSHTSSYTTSSSSGGGGGGFSSHTGSSGGSFGGGGRHG